MNIKANGAKNILFVKGVPDKGWYCPPRLPSPVSVSQADAERSSRLCGSSARTGCADTLAPEI